MGYSIYKEILLMNFDNFLDYDDYLKQFELKLDGIRNRIKINTEKLKAAKNEEQEDHYISSLDNDISELDSFIMIHYQTMIVGFYSYCERKLKNFLASIAISKGADENLIEDYDFVQIQKTFKQNLNVELKIIQDFNFVDELRLLNNCIKHSGKVSVALNRRNNRWIFKSEISIDKNEFFRLYNGSKEFFKNLKKELSK